MSENPQLRAAIFVSDEEATSLFLQLGKKGGKYEEELPRILQEMGEYGCRKAGDAGHTVELDAKFLPPQVSHFAAQLNFLATPENFGGVRVALEATGNDLARTANRAT